MKRPSLNELTKSPYQHLLPWRGMGRSLFFQPQTASATGSIGFILMRKREPTGLSLWICRGGSAVIGIKRGSKRNGRNTRIGRLSRNIVVPFWRAETPSLIFELLIVTKRKSPAIRLRN